MSARTRAAKVGIAIIALGGGVIPLLLGSAANGIPVRVGPTVSLLPQIAATTSAVADPSSTPWSSTSVIDVTTDSTGAVTYSVDPLSDPVGCSVDSFGNVSASAAGNCVVDVSVDGDGTFDPSSAQATVNFTAAAATTSAVATASSIPWSSTSTISVTTDSTGLVTYSVDPSTTAAGCAASPSSASSGTVSATGAGDCVIDVNVAADVNYLTSTTQATVSFTPASSTTSAVADPMSTPWSNTSAIDVTTDSTGTVTFAVDPSSTATNCAANTSGVVSATGSGSCVINVNVAADPNYLVSTAQATVTFTSPAGGGGGGGGGGGSSGITQTSPTTGTVATASSATFTAGPIAVQGNSGPVTFVVTKSSSSLMVSTSGLISTTGVLAGGTYSVSGTDSDTHGGTGTWTYSLKVTVTVTFSANGGSGTMSAETASAPTALSLNTFVRKGYTFTGWSTTPSGTGVSYTNGAVFPFESTTVLFARWKHGALPLHTITFIANGGTGHTPSEIENAPTAIAVNRFTRHGYVFVDWSTTSRGSGRSFTPGKTYAFKTSITLYARWKKVVAKSPKPPKAPKVPLRVVTFFANGGTGKMAAESKRRPAALTSDGFRRSHYSFIGWNTKSDGKGVAYANSATYSFKSSTDLYAQWKKNTPVPQPIAGGTIVGPFAVASTALTPGLESQIQGLAAMAKSKGATQITLYGCGDEVGSTSQASVELARARAGSVATYLGARLANIGLKGWTISITTASPSADEVGSVVATLS